MSQLNIVYAGDRDISVQVLRYLLEQGIQPNALLVSSPRRATHADELRSLCRHLNDDAIFVGTAFRDSDGLDALRNIQPDYIICIHFPYIVPQSVLEIPKFGVVNLHPAYLPYNRGWHTPTWALLEETPIGATLHFMDEGVDTGDIIHQKQLQPAPDDTAHSLYAKLKQLEFDVFCEAWDSIAQNTYQRTPQNTGAGTSHKKADLFNPQIQKIDLDTPRQPGELLRQLRALTTSRIDEAAYFEEDGKKYRVQVQITEETDAS